MRRFFALLLAAVLALSLLAGCTKSQEDAQQQTGTSSDVSMAVVVAGQEGALVLGVGDVQHIGHRR